MRSVHPLVVVLALAPLAAHSEDEWIDEFPSVTTVAHAAAEELKITYASSPNLDVTDDDTVAVNLTGTFVVLREILALKHVEGPRLSAAGEEKFRRLVAAYQEAELTIGQGGPSRHGYIRSATGGIRCGDNEACYQRWFLAHLHANTSRAEYRERFLRRLFPCGDLAQELNELRQAHTVGMPYYPSPATTFVIESEVAGIGPAGCSAYGGDTDQDGLCDDWGTVAEPSGCTIRLTSVRMVTGGGLKVSIAPGSANPGTWVRFRVERLGDPRADGGVEIPSKPAELVSEDTGDPQAPLYALVASDASLRPDADPRDGTNTLLPFLRVDATSVPSRGPVHCEQALPTWLPRHLEPTLTGLHGPYPTLQAAATQDEPNKTALRLTAEAHSTLLGYHYKLEHGYVILRSRFGQGGYYTTPPVRSSQPGFYQFILPPRFNTEDYYDSYQRAFSDVSCEDKAEFVVAGFVHSHPVPGALDTFSERDFEQAVQLFREGAVRAPLAPELGDAGRLNMKLEASVLLNAQACVLIFLPADAEAAFDEARYDQYVQRVGATKRCYPRG